jgi:hypothetical protein
MPDIATVGASVHPPGKRVGLAAQRPGRGVAALDEGPQLYHVLDGVLCLAHHHDVPPPPAYVWRGAATAVAHNVIVSGQRLLGYQPL